MHLVTGNLDLLSLLNFRQLVNCFLSQISAEHFKLLNKSLYACLLREAGFFSLFWRCIRQMNQYPVFELDIMLALRETLLSKPTEAGGFIGGKDMLHIGAFHPDTDANTNKNQYFPNLDTLNTILRKWYAKDLCFLGFIHTHPDNQPRLSLADIHFGQMFLLLNPSIWSIYIGVLTNQQLNLCEFSKKPSNQNSNGINFMNTYHYSVGTNA